jgi:hypothetical protein
MHGRKKTCTVVTVLRTVRPVTPCDTDMEARRE